MSSMDMNDGPGRGRGGGRYGGRSGGRGYNSSFGRGGSGFGRGGRHSGYSDDGGGGYSGGSYNNGGGRGRYSGGRGGQFPEGGHGRGLWGNRGRGRNQGGRARGRGPGGSGTYRDLPDDIEFLTLLKGHKRIITAVCLDPATKQLYTGSQDGFVRVINCESGQCTSAVEVGGAVDSLLLESGYLFVGMHRGTEGIIKVWNTATGQEFTLTGHQGQVLCLAAGNGALFSGGQDKSLRVWAPNPATGSFDCQIVLTSAQGGHKQPVQSIVTVGGFLISADWGGALKVWDFSSGQCVQTIQSAHNDVIMSMLPYEGVLITAGLDGIIKVWQPLETPVPGAVLESAPAYTHPPDDEDSEISGSLMGSQQPPRPGQARRRGTPAFGGVLAMCGTTDSTGKAVLATTHNDDNCIRLLELPTFADRGTIREQREARAVAFAPGGLIIAGNYYGDVRIWRWKP